MSLKSWTYTHIVVPGVPLASSVLASQADPENNSKLPTRQSQFLIYGEKNKTRDKSTGLRSFVTSDSYRLLTDMVQVCAATSHLHDADGDTWKTAS